MQSGLALFICILFILWLFARDQKLRPMTSWGLWVVLMWVAIIGSRPVGYWFGFGDDPKPPEFYLDGSPIDRNTFLVLIILGAVALWRRRPDWREIFKSNPWFFAFIIYCGISIIWSDYPFVSFKRWIKELGNIIMILIMLTEEDPIEATRAVFARYTYLAIPLSVVVIKFFPDIGSYYTPDSGEVLFRGIQIEKNFFGLIIFVSSLFLIWELIYPRSVTGGKRDKVDLLNHGVLLLLAVWLLYIANSSTALLCMILGASILLFSKLSFVKSQVRYLGTYSLVLGTLVFLLYYIPGMLDTFVGVVGRDSTFTGRTDIWTDLLNEPLNPLLGAGYQSFWLGSRMEYYFERYIFHLNQAHNGYLESYLNGGLIGLSLLMAAIVYTGRKLKKELLFENSFGTLLIAFLVVAAFYNLTEAMFGKPNVSWFTLSIAALYFPPAYRSITEEPDPSVQGDP